MKDQLPQIYEQITTDIFNIAQQELINKVIVMTPYLEGVTEILNLRKKSIINEKISVNEDNEYLQKFLQEISDRALLFQKSYATDTSNLIRFITAKTIEITSVYDHVLTQEQNQNRFKIVGNETFIWRIVKRSKKIFFHISKLSLYTGNFLRRIFKKPPKPIKYWNHNIDSQSVVMQNIVTPFIESMEAFEQHMGEQTLKLIGKLIEQVSHVTMPPYYTTETAIDYQQWEAQLKLELQKYFQNFKNNQFKQFAEDTEKSGTIELCKMLYKRKSTKNLKESSNQLIKTANLFSQVVEETLFHWSFSLRLHAINTAINVKKNQYQASFTQKFLQSTRPAQEVITNYLTATKLELEQFNEAKHEELRSFIVVNLYKVKKNVLPHLESITNLQFVQQLLNSAAKLENALMQIAEALREHDEKHRDSYKTRKLYKELWSFAPGKYIIETVMPEYLKKMSELKREITLQMESTGMLGKDLHHIIDFCFDTALDMIDNPKESSQEKSEQPWEVLNEGLNNAIAKSKTIEENGHAILKIFTQSLNDNIHFLNNRINELQFEKAIVEIKAKITKTQVLNKTQWILNKIKKYSLTAYKKGFTEFTKHRKSVNIVIQNVKKRLHLASPPKRITSELSNFLVEANQKIEKLPLVYKRLFELKQLDEANLFMGRKSEIEMLHKAYKDWTNGNYAATIVYGENGSGKSSLQSYFATTLKTNFRINQLKIERFFHTEQDFYDLMSEILQQPIKNRDQLTEYTDNLRQKKILIIDGLERLFIRKLYGNKCLHELLDYVLKTNQKFFWILTCAENAYNYLNKVYHIGDYFDYNLKIEKLDEDEILSIIFKRNRLSGYNIIFEPSEKDKTAKFNTLSYEQQQEVLAHHYFAKLNLFARSNLSIALSYWLASINKIKDHSLYIETFTTPEFSFLTNLSNNKTYALFLMILHGKLNKLILSESMHITTKQSERTLRLLKEDGILRFVNDYFVLHPMLFRNVVEQLQQKNLIH